jgi:hypothetical protein
LSADDNFSPAGTDDVRHGVFTTWLYAFLGVVPFTVEFWDVETEAGIEKTAFFMERGRTEDELLTLLNWADENCDGQGYFDWVPFDHPQLGPVERGGWNRMYVFRNPPAKLIEGMSHNSALFTLRHAAASPLLRVQDVTTTEVAPGLFQVEAIVANEGCMSTFLTEKGKQLGNIPGVQASLDLNASAEFVVGTPTQDLGHLAGYFERPDPWNAWGPPWADVRAKALWQVRVPAGQPCKFRVVAEAQKGGRVTEEGTLG